MEKKFASLIERFNYLRDVLSGKHNENVRLLESRLNEFKERAPKLDPEQRKAAWDTLEDLFTFVENKIEAELTPMDKVRIVRHPQRICLRDILENVYDKYTEIGSMDEHSLDPAVLIARAYITRTQGKNVIDQSVMVIGHEKGHGEEIRNGGSATPWGNAKALHYMKVAETENIPIHTYIFTPGAFPTEDPPGAAQQIAQNIYEMSDLQVPILTIISEGGSGGAEAIGLADKRLMLSHGYYSVISPEGASAIEGRLRAGERATPELIEHCATQLQMMAEDNLRMGYIDRIVQEPALGARCHNYEFFRNLRKEVLQATDEIVLNVRGFAPLRALALSRRRKKDFEGVNLENVGVRWVLSESAKARLVRRRHRKFLKLSKNAVIDTRPTGKRIFGFLYDLGWDVHSYIKYDLFGGSQKKLRFAIEEVQAEVSVVWTRLAYPWRKLISKLSFHNNAKRQAEAERQLTTLSEWNEGEEQRAGKWAYISPKAKEDRAITCPNSATHGCLDLWAPDLYGEFAGVCTNCGHHFPMEHQWYLYNVFDHDSIFEFNEELESTNPLGFEGLDLKLEQAKKKTGHKSACMTFEARLDGVKVVVAMLMADFRGGTVGAAEGEKFIQAAERAKNKRFPFLAYVHGTAGIRIQEGTNGVIQMPRCTMAVRRYIGAGGLYMVMYDTNSYAGPVASFLGCSPYQFGIRSSNVGFAGPGVIMETTGEMPEPHYHNVYKALARGHIQGIWDRREARFNLKSALMTMGGRNLYYR